MTAAEATMAPAGAARAVVTGIGVVAPTGVGVSEYWQGLLAGRSRIGQITLFDPSPYATTLAGEVTGFAVDRYADSRFSVQTDRWTHLGFAATLLALADAGLPEVAADPYACGVTLASSSGGNLFGQKEMQRLWGQPGWRVGAYQSIAWFYAASVGQLSIRHQLKGPCGVLVAEAAGGLDSLAQAVRMIRRGTSVVLAGATECPLSPYALACQLRSGLLSGSDDPSRAYLPFDVAASGYVPGEGGAVFVVENLDHAVARGAPRIYGEVAGWGATHDARPTGRSTGGDVEQYARAMRLALTRAEAAPQAVGVVVPDALGVPRYDRGEAAALRSVLPAGVPVMTHKPLVGRAHQGGAALDVAGALLSLHHGMLPASAGPQEPAPGCELAFVRQLRPLDTPVALVGARGFDGFNSVVVLRGYHALTEGGHDG